VSYLIETQGWSKLAELLDVFRDGSSYDSALREVYSCDIAALEQQWLAYVGAD